MSYTVLARRYRSQGFDDVIGQEAIAQTLTNAIKTGRVAHAYLFSGTRGVGKTTMARILAKALNCLESDGPTVAPCCKCDSCVNINTGDDIDVIEIDGASNTGVDNIRELRQNAIYRPARARNKIYIIDEVHMLSTGAFNALLKILEEPPEHVKFIFATTEPNKVLATIQSRCQRFDFINISAADIGKQLRKILDEEKIKYDDDIIIHLSRLANGSMRDGLSLLDQLISVGEQPLSVEILEKFLGQPNRAKVYQLVSNIAAGEGAVVLKDVDSLLSTGTSAVGLVDWLIDMFRDVMVAGTAGGGDELLILTEDEKKAMAKLSEAFDVAGLVYNITALEKLRWVVKSSDNPRAILEATLIRLALSEHFVGTDKLLEALKSGAIPQTTSPSVKKKLTADTKAKSIEKPAVEKVLAGEASLENIKSSWKAIAGAAGVSLPSVRSMLVHSVVEAFDDKTLTVMFPENMSMAVELLQSGEKNKVLTEAVSAAVGMEVKLKLTLGVIESEQANGKPKGAKISQSERKEILDNDAVQAVLKGLDATVTGIE